MLFCWFSAVKLGISRANPGLNMKSAIGFTAMLSFSLLAHTTWGLQCSEIQYPLGKVKCCDFCPPDTFFFHLGQQLAARCTLSTQTSCEPCEENYYNSDHTYSDCKRCTVCDKDKGLREVKKCTRESNTVCGHLLGNAPAGGGANDKRSDPCPSGGGKENSGPRRNCTSEGRNTLHPGTREENAPCNEQPTASLGPTAVALSSSQRQEHGGPTTKPSLTPFSLTTQLNKHKPKEAGNGLLTISLICVGLLLAIGGPVLLVLFWKAKKKKALARTGIFSEVPHEAEPPKSCGACSLGKCCENKRCTQCRPLPKCQEGEELHCSGTIDFKYSCKPCPSGTYSNTKKGCCIPWTDCKNLPTLFLGNRTHDTQCGQAPGVVVNVLQPESVLTTLFIVLTAAGIFVLVLMTFLLIVCTWMQKEKFPLEEEPDSENSPSVFGSQLLQADTSSCPFPEEERGDKMAEEKASLTP
ncbi:uncharacterized protein LOC134411556 [Elgaria multicarinata webbii]|uniref:uncharacterized protein LOC134411556 n=1 Tax=Elgaria multicarinata webbii TaxID=159646 RepID=UPI002FCD1EA7